QSLEDLGKPEILHVAIANPEHAPYGAAAKAALQNQGLWNKLEAKIVYGENVEQTFQFASTGNADAAIVGWSQVIHRGGFKLPAAWHPPITQTAGVVTSSKKQAAGRRFIGFLLSPDGKAVLREFGFDE